MKKIIQFIGIVVSLSLFWSFTSQAAEMNFSVDTKIPENQQDTGKSYFDLKLGVKEEQVLTVVLKNNTDEEVVVETSFNRATTNLNGVVDYGARKEASDASLLYNIEDFVQLPEKETTIPAQSEKNVEIKLNSPEKAFEGILAGGLTFKEKQKGAEKEKEEKGKGLDIENQYAYVVGLVLHGENENIPSEIKLTKAEAGQLNARNAIKATLQNPKPKYLNELSIKAEVTQKGKKEVLYSNSKENMQMAPNSNFTFPILLDGKPLKAGEYTVTMNIKSVSDKWTVTKDFTINKKAAAEYNEKDVSIVKDNTWIYIISGVCLLCLVGICSYLMYQHRKKERLRKERARKRAIQRKKSRQKKK